MTPLQAKRYWRLWREACLANGWTTVAGCVAADQDERVAAKSRLHAAALTFARQAAQAEHRAMTASDIRHGLHIAALGHPKSSKTLDNAELDRVYTAFELLADPDNLRAVIALDHPEEQERRRLLWSIRHAAPAAYIAAVAEGKFGARAWEDLGNRQLVQLLVTLKHRKPWRVKKFTRSRDEEMSGIECPF